MYLEEEEWRDIKGFEGLYQVSNLGNVRRMECDITYNNGTVHHYKEGIRKPNKDKDGYLYLNLWKDGKCKVGRIHKLVAETFIPNPNNYPVINHKDENKSNNRVENLEWCTIQYNAEYSLGKSVNQYTKDGIFIRSWKTITEASQYLNIDRKGISRVCMGNKGYYTCGGYIWRYKT